MDRMDSVDLEDMELYSNTNILNKEYLHCVKKHMDLSRTEHVLIYVQIWDDVSDYYRDNSGVAFDKNLLDDVYGCIE